MELQELVGRIIKWITYAYLLFVVFWKEEERLTNFDLGVKNYREITESGKLLNSTGLLENAGFSKKYLLELNHENIYPVMFGFEWFKYSRVKSYEHYWFSSGRKIINLIFSNLRYAGNVGVLVYDLEQKTLFKKEIDLFPFIDSDRFPQLSYDGLNCNNNYSVSKSENNLIVKSEKSSDFCKTTISVDVEGLKGEFLVHRSLQQEDSYQMIPISEDKTYWAYELKSGANKCDFNATLNNQSLTSDENCQAFVDVGRGVFFYKTQWKWASAMGFVKDNKKFSFNYQEGVADPTIAKSHPHFFKIDDKVVYLNPLELKFDPLNFMNSMVFSTHENFAGDNNNKAEIVFTSFHHVPKKDNFLIISSDFNLVYGTYSGWVTDDQGNKYEFEDVPGFFLKCHFNWFFFFFFF
jgi:hypothetical protein